MSKILIQLKEELIKYKVEKNSLKSLFIGGGTPSCIPYELYEPFFKEIKPYLEKNAEITTEANPNSASLQWLEGMKHLGINRISFGVQSFDVKKLKFLGRNHTPLQAKSAITHAKKIGIENISLDLIYATSIDTKELLKNDINTAFSLGINHLSSYALSIEEKTKFENKEEYKNDSVNLASFFIQEIKDRGFIQYEISNFGTYKSVHNLGYWSGEDYIGIGSGAVGFLKNKRFYPHESIEEYIKNPLHVRVESLSKEDLHVEYIFLGLRCEVGLAEENFSPKELEKLVLLVKEKKLKHENKRYYNTNYLLADEIALFIIS
jgi:oxygen-independent coproporphyrinogen-3 oxidase